MTSHQIRQQFLDFFRAKNHLIVPSAPLVLKSDPTLMFTNSGMAQFKDYFLGNATPPAPRIADTQKCLRVSGKHNDLEDVGFDTYHHTMFEMLGNWSFGDYFKQEALAWSWELLTDVYQLPKDRLYASVFGGDEAENLPFDQEAYDLWKQFLPEDRILRGSKKDNFWEMGDVGPCGPCSEIHIDLRPQSEVDAQPGRELVNNDHPQVVEIWNNVFMQFERRADRSLVPLPARHVDTGMGFERLCMAIQGKTSNYDTDVFQGLIQFIARAAGKPYGQSPEADIAMRVLADHIRAIAFTIADGQLPANNKAGYVIRRILRRAVRYGYTFLGFKEPFLCQLVPLLADQFADVFPELNAQRDFVARVIQEEEASFLRTLDQGLKKLEVIFDDLLGRRSVSRPSKQEVGLSGQVLFELYDTFGFPLDLSALIARERGLPIDEAGFEREMEKQRRRSQAAAASEKSDWTALLDTREAAEFLGYAQLEATAQLVKFREVKTSKGTQTHLVLDRTPFYAESGGQVGDTGTLTLPGGAVINVADTKKENDLTIHVSEDDGLFARLTDQRDELTGARLVARVDAHRRALTENNHSATHLLQAALRQVLGTHVAQRGSLVNDQLLRFDFSHFAKLTDEEISRVEQLVNQRIRQNIGADVKVNVPIGQAKVMGATALFGEKYGEFVRVVTFDPAYSVELCGGTHVRATGQIGYFKILSEGSTQAGVRRIEALTAERAEGYVHEQVKLLNDLKQLLKSPVNLRQSVENLLEERHALGKQLEQVAQRQLQATKQALLAGVESADGVNFLAARVEVPSAELLKQLAYELNAQLAHAVLVLAAEVGGKPQLAVVIAETLVQSRGLHAGNLVKELAREIGGGGGGQPFFATAGGTNASGIARALDKARTLVFQAQPTNK